MHRKRKNLIYIPSSSNGILYVLDLSNDKIIDTVSIGGSLSQVVLSDNELFVANEDSNSIYVLDKNTLNPIGIIELIICHMDLTLIEKAKVICTVYKLDSMYRYN